MSCEKCNKRSSCNLTETFKQIEENLIELGDIMNTTVDTTNANDTLSNDNITTSNDVKTHPDIFGDVFKFNSACEVIPGAASRDLYKNLITEEYNEFLEGVQNNDDVEILDALIDILYVVSGYGYAAGFDMIGAWNEVQASNMSKIDPTTGKAIKNENGKVMKPESYFAPKLESFV